MRKSESVIHWFWWVSHTTPCLENYSATSIRWSCCHEPGIHRCPSVLQLCRSVSIATRTVRPVDILEIGILVHGNGKNTKTWSYFSSLEALLTELVTTRSYPACTGWSKGKDHWTRALKSCTLCSTQEWMTTWIKQLQTYPFSHLGLFSFTGFIRFLPFFFSFYKVYLLKEGTYKQDTISSKRSMLWGPFCFLYILYIVGDLFLYTPTYSNGLNQNSFITR